MSVLWCGGEDVDFPNGNSPAINTTAGRFRSSWSRCDLTPVTTQTGKSTTFSGGAITSCWLTYQLCVTGAGGTSKRYAGLIQSGGVKGLWLGTAAASSTRLALISYDGTTQTELAAETGNSIPTNIAASYRIDFQLINFGASSTINVYLAGTLLINFSGSSSISGVTGFDQIAFFGDAGSFGQGFSEFIVSTADTRSLQGLKTLALTGAGDTNSWTNTTFSNINGTTLSDANPTSSNTTAQDNEYNVTDMPTGTFAVLAVKQTIRAAVSATPAVTQIKVGFKSGGSVAFGTGAAKTPAGVYGSFEQLDLTNPVTGVAFVQSDMNALQVDFQSLT